MGKDEREGVYVISVIGSTIRLLRDNARGAAVSHDGSKIAFADQNLTQIFIMDSDGQQVRPVITPKTDERVVGPKWSSDGRRLAYVHFKPAADVLQYTIAICDANGGSCESVFTSSDSQSYDWTPDGRIVISRTEPPPHSADSNLWEISIDTATGKPSSPIRRVTDWTGFSFEGLHFTADGKRMVFTNDRPQSDTYVGEFDSNGTVKAAQRFTLDERMDWPSGWTSDSKSVLFYSDRAGAFDIYRQALDSHSADAVVIGPEQKWLPQLSPDGQFVLYLSRADAKSSVYLMRAPVSGGAPERLLALEGAVDFNPVRLLDTAESFPSFHCGTTAGSNCVMAERSGTKIQFSVWDPAKNTKKEVFTLDTPTPQFCSWALSPDGSRLAINKYDDAKADVQVVAIGDQKGVPMPLKDVARLASLSWAPDGSGLYLVSLSSRGTTIFFAKTDGSVVPVYKTPWDIYSFSPSPDRKHASMGFVTTNANVWEIANFPKD